MVEDHIVKRSSLVEGQDFFEYEPEHWNLIVSNTLQNSSNHTNQ